MDKNYTLNHLVALVYNDVNDDESIALKKLIAVNKFISDEFNLLLETKKMLPISNCEPPQSVCNLILNYSKTAISNHHN